MSTLKNLTFCVFLGALAFTMGCSEDEVCGDGTCDAGETATSCSADCSDDTTTTTTTTTCNNDGTCDEGETFANCSADCNTLCTGTSDAAFRDGLAGDGSWADTDCAGLAQNTACVGGGVAGAGVACAAGTDETTCGAITGCVWADADADGTNDTCLDLEVATCAGAGAGGQTACEAASCVWSGTLCLPAQSEANCTAASAVFDASQGFECVWSETASMCWLPKTGSDIASGAASACGLGCISAADPVTCTIECMVGEDYLGTDSLSTDCLGCYSAVLGCTLENCLTECAALSTACDATCSDTCITALAGCGTCRTTNGCDDIFNLCADGTASE